MSEAAYALMESIGDDVNRSAATLKAVAARAGHGDLVRDAAGAMIDVAERLQLSPLAVAAAALSVAVQMLGFAALDNESLEAAQKFVEDTTRPVVTQH